MKAYTFFFLNESHHLPKESKIQSVQIRDIYLSISWPSPFASIQYPFFLISQCSQTLKILLYVMKYVISIVY